MGQYSRRQFLQLSGIALISTKFPPFSFPDAPIYYGRALQAIPLYTLKNLGSKVAGNLWPDSIMPIYSADDDWYHVPGGYVKRVMMQPMTRYEPSPYPQTQALPFWAEVAAPVAPIRQWCAADAPLVTRIGHGGVARIIDSLPGSREGMLWYGVQTNHNELLGWSQAAFWQPVQENTSPTSRPLLEIDQNLQLLTAYNEGERVLQALVSTGLEMIPGHYPVTGRQLAGLPLNLPGHSHAFHGVPWRIQFGAVYELSGAYWHNSFGSPMLGPTVQVPPFLASWLYGWLGDGGMISVS